MLVLTRVLKILLITGYGRIPSIHSSFLVSEVSLNVSFLFQEV